MGGVGGGDLSALSAAFTSGTQTIMVAPATSRFTQIINSEVGPKTVHFWAPVMKWALVFAGAKDMSRPVEKISGTQQIALTATGIIWTRWAMIIRPRNYLLASVNFFLGLVGGYQVSRLYNYERSLGYSPSDSFKNIITDRKAK